jgi:hypothetical protein
MDSLRGYYCKSLQRTSKRLVYIKLWVSVSISVFAISFIPLQFLFSTIPYSSVLDFILDYKIWIHKPERFSVRFDPAKIWGRRPFSVSRSRRGVAWPLATRALSSSARRPIYKERKNLPLHTRSSLAVANHRRLASGPAVPPRWETLRISSDDDPVRAM